MTTRWNLLVKALGVALLLGGAVLPAHAQGKVSDLPGLYESLTPDSAGDFAEFNLSVVTDGQGQDFHVHYRIDSVTSRSAALLTIRRLVIDGKPQGRGHELKTNFKRDRAEVKNLADQLLKNKESEGWKNLNVTKLEITGTEDVTAGGTTYSCSKIEFEYGGTVGDSLVPVTAKELLHYSDKVPVTRLAKFVGNYELSTINGIKKQTVQLVFQKSGKVTE